jgi:protein pelota
VKLRVENLDDLWYLSQIIQPGDVVSGQSERRVKDREDVRSKGGERKTVTLSVSVEKTELKGEANMLRVSGVISEGPEDIVSLGSHHTFSVVVGAELKVKKNVWGRVDLERLEDAVKSTSRPKVLVVAVDEGEATVGLVRESKVEYYDLERNIGGKYDLKGREARKHEFYRELSVLVSNIMSKEDVSHIILSGPGFEKNNYHHFLTENYGELAVKCVLEDTGGSGRNGIQEVLKREVIHRILEEVNAVRDIRYMEDVLKNIAKDTGLAVYGIADVSVAVNAGAVEVFLITDVLFFSERNTMEPLMGRVRSTKGVVHILNHETEAGQKLHSLGGVAAKLRYRLS